MYASVKCLHCGVTELTHTTDAEYIYHDIFGYSCLVCRMRDM